MTAVERYFFTPVYFPRNGWSVLKWWESRRVLFNVCVGTAGIATLGLVSLFASLPPHPARFLPPAPAILIYAVMANVGYTLGAPADLLLRRWFGDRAAAAGPVLFRYGFVFSVGLTLLPIPLAVLSWVVRFFVH